MAIVNKGRPDSPALNERPGMSKGRESFQIIERMVAIAKANLAIWFELNCNLEHGGAYSLVTEIQGNPRKQSSYHIVER